MIEPLYKWMQANPQLVVWAFALVNAVWIVVTYALSHRHDKSLKRLEHSLNLDLERRKTVFSLKTAAYERYLRMLDDFGAKHQSGLMKRMQPVFAQYMNRMLSAENETAERFAITTFGQDVALLMDESSADYIKLRSESRTLKLTASPELVQIFESMEKLVEESMKASHSFISDLPGLQLNNDQAGIAARLESLLEGGKAVELRHKELEARMRHELSQI